MFRTEVPDLLLNNLVPSVKSTGRIGVVVDALAYGRVRKSLLRIACGLQTRGIGLQRVDGIIRFDSVSHGVIVD